MSKTIEDITIYDLKNIIEKYSNARFKQVGKTWMACCPFHKEKNPSFGLYSEGNHARYKCQSMACGESGDAIDFLVKWKHISTIDAMLELGLEVDEKTKQQLNELDKVKKSAEWLANNNESLKGYKPVEFYPFKDLDGNVVRYEVKFRNAQGEKQPRPYRIDEKGIPKVGLQGVEDVPYNLHLAARELKKDKPIIFIVEGPKDCETVARELGYTALSFKNLNHLALNKFDYSIFNNTSIMLLGDTGKAGQKYIEEMREIFFNHSKGLYVVELPELEAMGDNKDITDWLEAGHTKEEFQRSIKKTLNLKDKTELQQDSRGIYKTVLKGKGDDIHEVKSYLTNFNIISAEKITYVDDDLEGICINCIDNEGISFKINGTAEIFADVRTFKKALGRISLVFKGNYEDLALLQEWISNYKIKINKKQHAGIQFKNNTLITHSGTYSLKGKISQDCVMIDDSDNVPTELNVIDGISKEELQQLRPHLFNFFSLDVCSGILGTIFHNFCYEKAKANSIRLHHLFILGAASSGKSTLRRVIMNELLGYPVDYAGHGLDKTTDFAITKMLSRGNFTKLFDEFKPTDMSDIALSKLSGILRNLYDGTIVAKGRKDQGINQYKLTAPLIIVGEYWFLKEEKALLDRSAIFYASDKTRGENSIKSVEFLQKNRNLVIKLSNSILQKIFSMSNDEYMQIREFIKSGENDLKDRPLNTYVNICIGLYILNEVCISLGVEPVSDKCYQAVKQAIKSNICNDGEAPEADYEELLHRIDDMFRMSRDKESDLINSFIIKENDKLYMQTSNMIDLLCKHVKEYGLSYKVMSLKDFKKRCVTEEYIKKANTTKRFSGIVQRCDVYDMDKLYKLGCYTLVSDKYLKEKEIEERFTDKLTVIK